MKLGGSFMHSFQQPLPESYPDADDGALRLYACTLEYLDSCWTGASISPVVDPCVTYPTLKKSQPSI